MSSQDLTLLENYLLLQKDEAIGKLIKGSDTYYYFTFLKHFNEHGYKLTEEQSTQLNSYKDFKTAYSQNITLRALFLEYDSLSSTPSDETEKRKSEIILRLSRELFGLQFNHQQPSRVKAPQGSNQEQNKLSILDESLISLEPFLNDAYTEKGFKKLQIPLYRLLDVKKIAQSHQSVIKTFLHNIGSEIVELQDIPFLYNEVFSNKKSGVDLGQAHFRKLTLSQMEELLKLNNKFLEDQWFVGEYYIKKFQFSFSNPQYALLSQEEKREIKEKLLKVYEWTLTLPPKFKSFNDQILQELLQVGIELNEYDFDLFITYLKDPREQYSYSTEQQLKNVKTNQRQYQQNWHEYHQLNINRWTNSNDLIKQYLVKYFEQKEESIFEPYLDTQFIKKTQALVKLYKGQEQQNIYSYFSNAEIEALNVEKQITICPYNKFTFSKDEEVKLYVELKNIPSLNIKIFQFGSENYYLQRFQEIDPQLNLDGLIASEEVTFEYKQAPVVKFTKEFNFDTISKLPRGVFVIEFIGNGISTRAIIKKGRLQLKENLTSAGHQYYILNEDFEVCHGDRTGLWVDNKFYKVDPIRQEILIPFTQTSQTFKGIIVHEDFAELTSISLQQENYQLKAAFLVTNEQLLMGAQAKTLIIPKLYINGKLGSLTLLKDAQVRVTSINDAGVPSTLPFDNVILSDDPLEISFPITAKVKTVTIQLTAKIQRLHAENGKKEQLLEQSHVIAFDSREGQNIFCQQYLKQTDSGYQIYLLGKNGEPKSGVEITVKLTLKNISHTVEQQLTTDNEGKITLGKLQNVISINSTVRPIRDISADAFSYNIQEYETLIQYPGQINATLGEIITLPIQVHDKVTLIQTFQNLGNANLHNLSLKIENKGNQISFTPTEIGSYTLNINQQQIYLNVLEGQKWKNTKFIKHKQGLNESNAQNNKLNISEVKQDQNKISVEIQGQGRLIAFAGNFVQNQNVDIIKAQLNQFLQKQGLEGIRIDLPTSVYQNNKQLSDEQRYVLNRKNQERYIGNTLEKPQIILNRQKIRETNTSNEQLSQGQDYATSQARAAAPQSQVSTSRKMMGAYGSVGGRGQGQIVRTFQDFIKNPAIVISKSVKDGVAELEIPQHFQNVIIFAYNDKDISFKQFGLKDQVIQTRNLQHQSALSKDKFYSIYRNSQQIQQGQVIQIADLTSTEIKLVDSLDKMYVLLKELRKVNGDDSEQEKGFEYWEFLTKWHKNEVDQKHKLYDEYQCNELNLFIYFRDPAYFDTYTKAYISNKIEKDFIDYFLLEKDDQLQKYASAEQLINLNALEQVLLVIYFAEIKKDNSIAKQIAAYLENKGKIIPQDQKRYKSLFDTVLGAKTAEEQEFGAGGGIDPMMMVQQQQFSNVSNCYQQQSFVQHAMPMASINRSRGMMNRVDQQLLCMNSQNESLEMECDMACERAYAPSAPAYYDQQRSKYVDNFKNLEKTNEYGEKHYCKTTQFVEATYLVSLNNFWVDAANHSINKGILTENFLSNNFIYCNSNHTEMIAVLALLGLKNESVEQEYSQFEGKGVQIKTKSPALLFTKEIKEGKAQLRNDILVAQRFFDPNDRFTYSDEDPELQLEKDVSECLVDKIYGCQVIITNCSSTRADYQVLVEVPNGAIPVNTVAYTKSYTIRLEPYSTQRIEYYFYFPIEGKFDVYPANVSRFGSVVCVAKEQLLTAVHTKTAPNLEVLDDILSNGNQDDILNFVANKNIFNGNIFKSHEILYLLKDKSFYLRLIDVLRKRKYQDMTIWSYAFYHNDHQSLVEYFNYQATQSILESKFKYFKCSLFEVNNQRLFEYYPLITKRVHKLTQDAKGILNIEFRQHYQTYLLYLTEKAVHTLSDKLAFIYYLLLQERINEAVQVFKTTEAPTSGEGLLQYDYFTAYLDFYIGYPNFVKARQICEKYVNYPIIHWRNLFYEIINQLAEFDGDDDQNVQRKATTKVVNQENANKEETLTAEIEGTQINLTYSNLDQVTIQFYKIDLEILFSRNPFLNDKNEDYSFVIPNLQLIEKIVSQPGLTQKVSFEIPNELRSDNLFIQVKGINKRAQVRYFSTSLQIQIMENYGQIKISDQNGKYLSKIYIKTYIKEKNGTESFYKDGYTDLRGRFDYASLSSTALQNADKFSILIMSDELGSVIREVKAPAQVGKFEQEVKLVSTAWSSKAQVECENQREVYTKNRTKHMLKY